MSAASAEGEFPYVWMVQSEKDVMHYEPFREVDSTRLEAALAGGESKVLLDGGRQEVNLDLRLMTAVYWSQRPRKVVRALWFFKSAQTGSWEPYSETDSASAEGFYASIRALKKAPEQCELFLSDGAHKLVAKETSPAVALLAGLSDTATIEYVSANEEEYAEEELSPRSSTSGTSSVAAPSPPPQTVRLSIVQQRHDGVGGRRAVCRGLPYTAGSQASPQGLSSMDEEQDMPVEHLVLVIHGIGEALFSREDFSSPSFRDSVRNMASIALKQQLQKFPDVKTRIEFLPIEWYRAVHGTNPGFVDTLQSLTLPSLSRLRQFNHDVLMDVMYYMSPPYKQKIVNTVTHSINAVYHKFMKRNPRFRGSISLVGFSLGSIILFDVLSNQKDATVIDVPAVPPVVTFEDPPSPEPPTPGHLGAGTSSDENTKPRENRVHASASASADEDSLASTEIEGNKEHTVGYTPGIVWPELLFKPERCFTLGAPIGMFLAVRDDVSFMHRKGFKLPTCPKFYNVFHPYDPIAYRIEPVLDDRLRHKAPVLIPHHTGRRRMHVQLRESFRGSAQSITRTFYSVSSAFPWRTGKADTANASAACVADTHVVVDGKGRAATAPSPHETSLRDVGQKDIPDDDTQENKSKGHRRGLSSENFVNEEAVDDSPLDLALNQGRRVDFQLQEAPLENANEYIAALGSHAGYFTSDDTCLFICKTIRLQDKMDE